MSVHPICRHRSLSALISLSMLALAPATATAGTFLHYSFDDTFDDQSGNGNHGILVDVDGDSSFSSTNAIFGSSWSHAGNDEDAVVFTTPFQAGPSTAWSMSFWHQNRGAASLPLFNSTTDNQRMLLRADTLNGVEVQLQGQPNLFFDAGGALLQYGFHHYALVIDPTGIPGVDSNADGVDDTVAVYFDGVLLPETSGVDLSTYDTSVTCDNFGDGATFNDRYRNGSGVSDELWIFEDHALTASEVQSLFTVNVPPCFGDADGDGLLDCVDVCPAEDATACDLDADGCLDDLDGDGLSDCADVCPTVDATACDLDADGCLDDLDGDGLSDCADVCPTEDATACDADADGCLDDANGNGVCDALDLLLQVSDVVAGAPMSLTVTHAPASGRVFFGVSQRGVGSGPCGRASSGAQLCTDLLGLVQLGTAVADADGNATLSLTVPGSLPSGTTLYFQAAYLDGDGRVSDVVEVVTGP